MALSDLFGSLFNRESEGYDPLSSKVSPGDPRYMRPSQTAEDFIKNHEKLRLNTYDDGTRTKTIGWGHTGAAARRGQPITQERAQELFAKDIADVQRAIAKNITAPLKQSQYDALISFGFNAGPGAIASVAKNINAGDYDGAIARMGQYTKGRVGGGPKQTMGGLVKRRAEETALWKGNNPNAIADLQTKLAAAGFDPGKIDNIMGPQTQRAMDAAREAQTQSASMGLPLRDMSPLASITRGTNAKLGGGALAQGGPLGTPPRANSSMAMSMQPTSPSTLDQIQLNQFRRDNPASPAPSLGGRYVPPSTPLRVELNAGERDRLMGRTPPVAPVASPQLRPSLTMAGLPPANAGPWPAHTRTSVNPDTGFPTPTPSRATAATGLVGQNARTPTQSLAARLSTARPAYTPPPAPQVPTAKPPAPPVPAAKPVLGQTLFETLASGAKDLAKSAIKPAVSFYMASGPVERAAKVGTARGAPGFWDAINASRLGPTDMARASFMAAQLYGPQALGSPLAMQQAAQVQAASGGSRSGNYGGASGGRSVYSGSRYAGPGSGGYTNRSGGA